MGEVTISSKYQVVLPKEIRSRLNLKAGQKLQVMVKGNTITMVPLYPAHKMRGMFKGMDTGGFREEEERV
ncbi:AbrB family transcriptional regulator [Clostridiales bacterium PH28_bin88]|nr:AbrB family transcriptional regulator [Clostridiales bacterium PH28_bin88]